MAVPPTASWDALHIPNCRWPESIHRRIISLDGTKWALSCSNFELNTLMLAQIQQIWRLPTSLKRK